MNIKNISNVQYAVTSTEAFNCEIELDTGEILPFTASPYDSAEHGREIYADILAGKYGEIAPADEEKVKEYRISQLSFERDEKLTKTEQEISKLKVLIDEVNYGVSEGDLEEVTKNVRTLVKYRKTLNSLDLGTIDEVPAFPELE